MGMAVWKLLIFEDVIYLHVGTIMLKNNYKVQSTVKYQTLTLKPFFDQHMALSNVI